jgi:hypothetical protein
MSTSEVEVQLEPTDEEQAEIIRSLMAQDAETTGFLERVEAARAARKPMTVEATEPIKFRWHNGETLSGEAVPNIRGPMMGRPAEPRSPTREEMESGPSIGSTPMVGGGSMSYNADLYRPTADGDGIEPKPGVLTWGSYKAAQREGRPAEDPTVVRFRSTRIDPDGYRFDPGAYRAAMGGGMIGPRWVPTSSPNHIASVGNEFQDMRASGPTIGGLPPLVRWRRVVVLAGKILIRVGMGR